MIGILSIYIFQFKNINNFIIFLVKSNGIYLSSYLSLSLFISEESILHRTKTKLNNMAFSKYLTFAPI